MFGFLFKSQPEFERVTKAVTRSVIANIRHGAFAIRKTIRESINKSADPSAPGKPVATRGKRGNVKASIFAAIEADNAIIGPRYSMVGLSMEAHEFGKQFKGDSFAARPTSGPGLTANTDRFAESFRGSVGE